MLSTTQVNGALIASVVSSRNASVPLVTVKPFWSSHSILSTAKSVVQLRVAKDPSKKTDSFPVILIPLRSMIKKNQILINVFVYYNIP